MLTRQGTGDRRSALHDVFGTADAEVAVSIRDAGRRDEFIAQTCGGAAGNVPALVEWMAGTAATDVVAAALAQRIPAAKAARLTEVVSSALIELPLDEGSHKVFGSPFIWPARNVAVRRAAPNVGEHDTQWLPRGSESRQHEGAHP
jgi:hypothetical protein